jgi:hypothetical protein
MLRAWPSGRHERFRPTEERLPALTPLCHVIESNGGKNSEMPAWEQQNDDSGFSWRAGNTP